MRRASAVAVVVAGAVLGAGSGVLANGWTGGSAPVRSTAAADVDGPSGSPAPTASPDLAGASGDPGAGTRVRVDLTGRWTAAHEVAATFSSVERASAAYDALRTDLPACRSGAWAPPGVRLAVGPEVRVDVPGADDRGVWSTVVPDASTPPPGVMGVLLVGRRVAVVQVDDPSPRAGTVDAIMSRAARRLDG